MKSFFLISVFFLPLLAFQQAGNFCQLSKHNLFSPPTIFTAPENLRSDTANVLQYDLSLDITDFTTDTIRGSALVRFVSQQNGLNYLCLDFLKMKIDSVTNISSPLTYSYNDTLLKINLPLPLAVGDTNEVIVYYHGKPVTDNSGWGGWYRQGSYAYNLGVGFDANPHVYGRVWHPCFDNFAERARYTFAVTTSGGRVAYCNGELVKDTTDNNGLRTRIWEMQEEIPSYLASVAVAPYTQVNQVFNSQNGPVPVVLTALPADTTNLKNSFIHLQDAFVGFENWYGPYVWNRVGFCLVPFNSGAMEHATNIAYPRATANGTLTYEADLMAHELSHHWWGDHTTCETAGDMWLNEGMASYSEYLFRDWVYGWQTYIDAIKINHEEMVHFAHLREGPLALSSVPHQYTYGDHVYRKGADVAHTMRAYLGDSLFSVGLKYVQQQKSFQNINSVEMGSLLTTATGINMNQFITDWVLNPGWPNFTLDSVSVTPITGGQFAATVFVRQRLAGAPFYYTNVPLEITFKNTAWQNETRKIMVSGFSSSATFTLPFIPEYSGINLESRISDAVSSKYKIIKSSGSVSFTPANLSLNVISSGADSSFVRVEHHFVKPDSIKNNFTSFRLNTQHYWKVDGIFSSGFHSKATFWYDGRKSTSGATQYLDTCLTTVTADSIVLLYRKDVSDDWHEVDKYTKTKLGGSNGKFGYFTVDTLRKGEYASANGISGVLPGFKELQKKPFQLLLYPNPAQDQICLSIAGDAEELFYVINDNGGKQVARGEVNGGSVNISLHSWPAGLYTIQVRNKKGITEQQKFIRSR